MRLLVIAALLFAQQVALAHQVWHSAAQGKPAAAEPGKKANPLCEQHEALGTVLGALSGAAFLSPTIEPPAFHFRPACVPAARVSLLSPVSRGPPALL